MLNNFSVKNFHSFSINVNAKKIINIYSIKELYYVYNYLLKKNIKSILIGNGTNSIFLKDFNGYILINKILGININENYNYWLLHVNSGESWSKLVLYTLRNNMPGLENLAMIPGKVGAAPIYNIGAYGSEFKNFCLYVDILNLKNGKIIRLKYKQCKFKYRESILKKLCNKLYFVVSVGLYLLKKWKPNILHNSFKNNLFSKKNITPKYIFNFICKLRKNNIPNTKTLGNSGSIFKNPDIHINKIKKLKLLYKNIPFFILNKNKVRVYAGWLIETCGLKNFRIGNASVSENNALIIINLGNAKGDDLISLIKIIYNNVKLKFNIKLELEVSLISNNGKIFLNDFL